MNNRMRSAGALVLSLLLALAGCTLSLPWHRDGGGSMRSSKAGGEGGSLGGGTTYPSSTTTPGDTPTETPLTAATQSVNKAFKSAGDKIASALEVQPTVIPTDDPAKLSSRPEQLTSALYVQAAQWSENQGMIAQAKQQFEKALELEPRNVNTLIAFARFHDRQGNGDEALRRYQQARGLAPTNTIVLNDLGLFHARRGDLAASLDALQQAVRLDPRNVRYRNNLAAALIESKRVAEAVDVLRAVHPEATALFNVACLLSMKNETQQAATLLEQALRIDPSLVAASQMLRGRRGPDTMLAQPAMPPGGGEATTLNPPLPAALETAYRSRPRVWESTPARDRSAATLGQGDAPRNLPSPE